MAKWVCQTCGKKLKNRSAASGHRRYLPDHAIVSDEGEALGDPPVAIEEAVGKIMDQEEEDPEPEAPAKANPLPPRSGSVVSSLRLDERTGRVTLSVSIDMTTLWRWRWMVQNELFSGGIGQLFDWALDDALKARGVAAPDAVLDPNLAKEVFPHVEVEDDLPRSETTTPNDASDLVHA